MVYAAAQSLRAARLVHAAPAEAAADSSAGPRRRAQPATSWWRRGAVACVRGPDADVRAGRSEQTKGSAARRWPAGSPIRATRSLRRSIVNRVWQYHFGRGIVDTPNDFGRMGSLPTHPELLDWLAGWFIDHGQSLKSCTG